MEITDLLTNNGYIIVNKILMQEYGLEEAIIIGEISSEYNYYKSRNELLENGAFYSTVENIEQNTTLSQYQQSKAINHLKELGLIEVYYKGIPPKRYIIQHFIKLFDLYKSKNLTFKDEKTLSLKIKKLNTNNNNNINNNKKNNNIIEKKFKAPTLEEIQEYCKQRNNNIDVKKFFDYYEVGDWKDSKGNKIKNWKQKIITWEKHQDKTESKANFKQRDYKNLDNFYI